MGIPTEQGRRRTGPAAVTDGGGACALAFFTGDFVKVAGVLERRLRRLDREFGRARLLPAEECGTVQEKIRRRVAVLSPMWLQAMREGGLR